MGAKARRSSVICTKTINETQVMLLARPYPMPTSPIVTMYPNADINLRSIAMISRDSQAGFVVDVSDFLWFR
jgi:hypothetical protein